MQTTTHPASGKTKDFINGHEIRVVGMSRSGNHAVIHWMLAQMQGRTCHLNCVEPKTNPYETAREILGRSWHTNYPFELKRERAGNFSRKEYLLYNYEDCFLGMVGSEDFEARHDAFVGASRRRTDVLILRDPFNLFASRRRGIWPEVSDRATMRIWKQHARMCLGRNQFLKHEPMCILYNQWVSDREYRAQIAAALGIPFSDSGRQRVAECGGGSSFDGLRFDGNAERMEVFRRWTHYADDASYRQLFDAEMVSIAADIFEDLPATASVPLVEAAESLGWRWPVRSALADAA